MRSFFNRGWNYHYNQIKTNKKNFCSELEGINFESCNPETVNIARQAISKWVQAVDNADAYLQTKPADHPKNNERSKIISTQRNFIAKMNIEIDGIEKSINDTVFGALYRTLGQYSR